jgi:hypothetical protein
MNNINTRLILILGAVVFLMPVSPAQAQMRDVQAYANRQTFFNDVTDYFATLGKSGKEKAIIEQKRHVARRKARLDEAREQNKKRATRRRQ